MKILTVPSSGSLAGQTASHNRAGQYLRNRRSPVQPIGTGRRAFIRAAFGTASAGYNGLTTAQQNAWSSYADAHPITDALGQSIKLTGHQMYISCATSLINVGQPPAPTAPASSATDSLAPVVMTFSVATGISITNGSTLALDYIAYALTRPVSSAVRFIKTFWQPLGADGFTAGAVSPYALTTAKYAAQFGAPVPGQRVFARVTPVSQYGVSGAPSIVSALVVP